MFKFLMYIIEYIGVCMHFSCRGVLSFPPPVQKATDRLATKSFVLKVGAQLANMKNVHAYT